MSLIVMAVVASGVLSSKLLLATGVHSLRLRYPIAVLCAYGVFLGMVRLWVWYVSIRQSVASSGPGNLVIDGGDVSLPDISSGDAPVSFGGFGGGDSGGGGASDAWGIASDSSPVPVPSPVPSSVPSGSGGKWFPDFDLDLGDDGWWVLLALALLAIVIFCAGGYLVWAAPDILGEAAWQAVLGGMLVRAHQHTKSGWMYGVVKSTAIPFAVVIVVAGALGWQAHKHCPEAARLADVFHCVAR